MNDKNKSNNSKNKKDNDYMYCPICNKKYPDNIIKRIETFKFKLTIRCPSCGAYSTIGEF